VLTKDSARSMPGPSRPRQVPFRASCQGQVSKALDVAFAVAFLPSILRLCTLIEAAAIAQPTPAALGPALEPGMGGASVHEPQ